MKKITFLVCNNGFGHFKRCVKVINRLFKKKEDIVVNLICTKDIVSKHKNWEPYKKLIDSKNFNFIQGSTIIKLNNKNDDFKFEINRFSTFESEIISDSSLVVSDNIGRVLEIKHNAILMGSFLWSEIIAKLDPNNYISKAYLDVELKLLKKYKPIMISLEDMAMPFVRKFTNPFFTSWMVEKKYDIKIKSKIKNILIVGGGTGLIDKSLINIIHILVKDSKYFIYTSDNIMKKLKFKSNAIKSFSFDEKDFLKIDLIIARPGIGTISDSVKYCIPLMAIAEKNNSEMEFNLSKVEVLGYGYDITNNYSQISNLVYEIQKNGDFDKFQKKLRSTKKNGLEEVVDFLINKIN